MKQRLSLIGLLAVLLSACQIAPPIQPVPTRIPPTTPSITPARNIAALPLIESSGATVTPTVAPTLTPTPTPTTTLTPIPTLTPQPTVTPTQGSTSKPVVLIERPLANEFTTATITVAGKVANVGNGVVLLQLRSPDGQQLVGEPVLATTEIVTDGIAFRGQISYEAPPTPRPYTVFVEWAERENAQSAASASQQVALLGRYGRVDRVIVEQPRPFERGDDDALVVRGVAPGPPARIAARLVDENDQVIESTEATLLWNQPGLPCAFTASLPNNRAATQLQVISFGPDDQVIEAVRVRLEPKP